VFHDLVGGRAELVHVADPWLLASAIERGVTDDVVDAVTRHVQDLADDGAEAVLVTCSSIGEAAETAASRTGVRVIRVDEAMARQAASIAGEGGTIAVLATLPATLGPTGRLVERFANGATVTATVVEGAAAARAGGDDAEHDRLIRDAIASVNDADVIVLAQASMARAATGAAVPVLSSPESGAESLVEALRA
jgi:hypothetical protein